jgi:DNA-binding transcriptional LysR family regulator
VDRFTALRVFRSAVELGSFAATGRHLGLSPAAVSKNVSQLEAHLGVRLLQRTTRRMSLTEAGSTYYDRVARALDDLEDADGMVGAMREAPKGRLRVSAPMTVTLICLSTSIPRFLRRYPDVSLDLQLDDRRVDIVEEGFDLAIRGTDRLEDSSLVARKLMTLTHVVCGAPSYFERFGVPAAPEDLSHHECIKFSVSGHAHQWTLNRSGRTARQRISGRYDVRSGIGPSTHGARRVDCRCCHALRRVPVEAVRRPQGARFRGLPRGGVHRTVGRVVTRAVHSLSGALPAVEAYCHRMQERPSYTTAGVENGH